ncbi:MAG: hypothetical protein ACO1SV_13220 [Fimbriimonas sp.]
MNAARSIVASVVTAVAVYAIGQGTSQSTSTSQSKNGGASASASSSSSSRGGGQGGSHMLGGGMNVLRPTHVVTYRFSDRGAPNTIVRSFDPALFERENQFWSRLARGGKLVMAGYWREKDGAMAVLSVRDDREAMQLLQSDPAIKQGAAYDVRVWDASVVSLGGGLQGGSSQTSGVENGSSQSSGQRTSSSGR